MGEIVTIERMGFGPEAVAHLESGKAVFALKNRFFDGEELELIQPGQAPYVFRAENVTDDEGAKRELFNVPQMHVHFAFPFKVSEWAILRKVKERPE